MNRAQIGVCPWRSSWPKVAEADEQRIPGTLVGRRQPFLKSDAIKSSFRWAQSAELDSFVLRRLSDPYPAQVAKCDDLFSSQMQHSSRLFVCSHPPLYLPVLGQVTTIAPIHTRCFAFRASLSALWADCNILIGYLALTHSHLRSLLARPKQELPFIRKSKILICRSRPLRRPGPA